jgi:GTP-binding protein YchF
MQIGIVGLPQSGKTTLFRTLTKTYLDSTALTKMETHQAVVKVPDKRLDKLAEIFKPKKKTNAAIEFVDVIGLHKGDSGSPQFTNNFLAKVRTNDALVQVVRLFRNEMVPHLYGSIDPMRDVNIFETEFIISDMALIESRIDKVKKNILKTNDENLKKELPLLEKCYDLLQNEIPLRGANLSGTEEKKVRSYQLLTLKPMLLTLNLDETQQKEVDKHFDQMIKSKIGRNTRAIAFFGQLEMEMSELSDQDAAIFMQEYGIKEFALHKLIREAYELLGVCSFFTVSEEECHSWTIKKGTNVHEAARVVHTDFYERFIRAEVVHFDGFINYGSFAKAKEHGAWRLEGKEYIVKDGDIILIRHN